MRISAKQKKDILKFDNFEDYVKHHEATLVSRDDFNKVKEEESTRDSRMGSYKDDPRLKALEKSETVKDLETKEFWEELSKKAHDPNKRKAINEAAKNIPNELKKKDETDKPVENTTSDETDKPDGNTPGDETDKPDENTPGGETNKPVGNTKWQEFWDKVKEVGISNAYPLLKAISDTLSKNAQMTMDQANILTGKGSDPSIYSSIETEFDKIRDKQIDFRAKYGVSYEEAIKKAQEGDLTYIQRMVAGEDADVDTVAKALNLTVDELKKRFEQINRANEADTVKKESEATKSILEIRSLSIEQKTMLQNNINTLRAQVVTLRSQAAALRTDDAAYDTYTKAINAYVGTARGLQQTGDISNVQQVINNAFSVEANQKAGVSGIGKWFVEGEINLNNQFSHDRTKTEGNTSTLSEDALALSEYKDAKQYAQASKEKTKESNNAWADKLDYMADEIEKNIDGWEEELNKTTKLNYSYKGANNE